MVGRSDVLNASRAENGETSAADAAWQPKPGGPQLESKGQEVQPELQVMAHRGTVILSLCSYLKTVRWTEQLGDGETRVRRKRECLLFPKAGKASAPPPASSRLHPLKTLASRCQSAFASHSRSEGSLPGFGMIMATGTPEPCDGRWRDTINGASQDLSAAQRVEGRVREG